MKQIIFLSFCSFIFVLNVSAQKLETFDIISFKTPNGWQKAANENAVLFTREDKAKGTYCLMTLYKSVPGTPDSKENFELAWTSLVKEMVTVADAPKMEPSATDEGWEIQSGYAAFESDGSKGVVFLVTASGFEKMVNLIILTNTDAYEKETSSFIESLSLKKSISATKPTKSNPTKLTNQVVVASKDGFKFTTSNFDDGWTSAVQNDWVQVTKGDIKVLLHYALDESKFHSDPGPRTNTAWDMLVAPRYSDLKNYKTTYIGDYGRACLGMGNVTDKATGTNVYVVLYNRGQPGWFEFITSDKNSFIRQYNFDPETIQWNSNMDLLNSLAKMGDYNKFAVAASDVPGTWVNSSSIYSQYYNTNTGNYAGMGGVSINDKFAFNSNGTFYYEYLGVSGMMDTPDVHTEKRNGKFTVSNWEMTITDKKGIPVAYSAQFEVIRGGRILHLQNKQFSGLKYQLYKQK